MARLIAQVRHGRLFVDMPSSLPERTVVELEIVAMRIPSDERPSTASGEFDDSEADTAVGPIVSDEVMWAALSKPSG
jgi:hypothetical protein